MAFWYQSTRAEHLVVYNALLYRLTSSPKHGLKGHTVDKHSSSQDRRINNKEKRFLKHWHLDGQNHETPRIFLEEGLVDFEGLQFLAHLVDGRRLLCRKFGRLVRNLVEAARVLLVVRHVEVVDLGQRHLRQFKISC